MRIRGRPARRRDRARFRGRRRDGDAARRWPRRRRRRPPLRARPASATTSGRHASPTGACSPFCASRWRAVTSIACSSSTASGASSGRCRPGSTTASSWRSARARRAHRRSARRLAARPRRHADHAARREPTARACTSPGSRTTPPSPPAGASSCSTGPDGRVELALQPRRRRLRRRARPASSSATTTARSGSTAAASSRATGAPTRGARRRHPVDGAATPTAVRVSARMKSATRACASGHAFSSNEWPPGSATICDRRRKVRAQLLGRAELVALALQDQRRQRRAWAGARRAASPAAWADAADSRDRPGRRASSPAAARCDAMRPPIDLPPMKGTRPLHSAVASASAARQQASSLSCDRARAARRRRRGSRR